MTAPLFITQKYFASAFVLTREFCDRCRFIYWETLKGQGRLDSSLREDRQAVQGGTELDRKPKDGGAFDESSGDKELACRPSPETLRTNYRGEQACRVFCGSGFSLTLPGVRL